jgi:hypothetical protein
MHGMNDGRSHRVYRKDWGRPMITNDGSKSAVITGARRSASRGSFSAHEVTAPARGAVRITAPAQAPATTAIVSMSVTVTAMPAADTATAVDDATSRADTATAMDDATSRAATADDAVPGAR